MTTISLSQPPWSHYRDFNEEARVLRKPESEYRLPSLQAPLHAEGSATDAPADALSNTASDAGTRSPRSASPRSLASFISDQQSRLTRTSEGGSVVDSDRATAAGLDWGAVEESERVQISGRTDASIVKTQPLKLGMISVAELSRMHEIDTEAMWRRRGDSVSPVDSSTSSVWSVSPVSFNADFRRRKSSWAGVEGQSSTPVMAIAQEVRVGKQRKASKIGIDHPSSREGDGSHSALSSSTSTFDILSGAARKLEQAWRALRLPSSSSSKALPSQSQSGSQSHSSVPRESRRGVQPHVPMQPLEHSLEEEQGSGSDRSTSSRFLRASIKSLLIKTKTKWRSSASAKSNKGPYGWHVPGHSRESGPDTQKQEKERGLPAVPPSGVQSLSSMFGEMTQSYPLNFGSELHLALEAVSDIPQHAASTATSGAELQPTPMGDLRTGAWMTAQEEVREESAKELGNRWREENARYSRILGGLE